MAKVTPPGWLLDYVGFFDWPTDPEASNLVVMLRSEKFRRALRFRAVKSANEKHPMGYVLTDAQVDDLAPGAAYHPTDDSTIAEGSGWGIPVTWKEEKGGFIVGLKLQLIHETGQLVYITKDDGYLGPALTFDWWPWRIAEILGYSFTTHAVPFKSAYQTFGPVGDPLAGLSWAGSAYSKPSANYGEGIDLSPYKPATVPPPAPKPYGADFDQWVKLQAAPYQPGAEEGGLLVPKSVSQKIAEDLLAKEPAKNPAPPNPDLLAWAAEYLKGQEDKGPTGSPIPPGEGVPLANSILTAKAKYDAKIEKAAQALKEKAAQEAKARAAKAKPAPWSPGRRFDRLEF